jgi:hypothetical protein
MLTEKDFYDYFAEETISIGFVSTQKPEEPYSLPANKNPQKEKILNNEGKRQKAALFSPSPHTPHPITPHPTPIPKRRNSGDYIKKHPE